MISKKSAALIIALAAVLVYSNSFRGSFHFDDFSFITGNPAVCSGDTGMVWRYWPSRFLGMLTFAWNYRAAGAGVFWYHFINVSLHILASLLVMWMAVIVCGTPQLAARGFRAEAERIGLFAGLLFALHPVQTQAVNYLFQRVTILATVFYLVSVGLYLRSAGSAANRRLFYLLSFLAGLAAAFTKETAGTLPLMILTIELFLMRRRSLPWKLILPFFLVPVLVLLLLFSAKPVTFTDIARIQHSGFQTSAAYFFTSLRVIMTYIRLCFIPAGQNLDYDYPLSRHFLEPEVVASACVISAIAVLGWRARRSLPLVAFGVFWFLIALLPDSSFIPLLDVINEYRLYLPMAGFSLIAASAVYSPGKPYRARAVLIMLSVTALLCGGLTYKRNFVWKDEVTLWSDVISKSPKKPRGYNERGLALLGSGRYAEAISDFNRLIELAPGLPMAWNNRGLVYMRLGRVGDAAKDFTRAIQLDPNYYDAYVNRGIMYLKSGQNALADLDFQAARRLCPHCSQ